MELRANSFSSRASGSPQTQMRASSPPVTTTTPWNSTVRTCTQVTARVRQYSDCLFSFYSLALVRYITQLIKSQAFRCRSLSEVSGRERRAPLQSGRW